MGEAAAAGTVITGGHVIPGSGDRRKGPFSNQQKATFQPFSTFFSFSKMRVFAVQNLWVCGCFCGKWVFPMNILHFSFFFHRAFLKRLALMKFNRVIFIPVGFCQISMSEIPAVILYIRSIATLSQIHRKLATDSAHRTRQSAYARLRLLPTGACISSCRTCRWSR